MSLRLELMLNWRLYPLLYRFKNLTLSTKLNWQNPLYVVLTFNPDQTMNNISMEFGSSVNISSSCLSWFLLLHSGIESDSEKKILLHIIVNIVIFEILKRSFRILRWCRILLRTRKFLVIMHKNIRLYFFSHQTL